jgi:predicted Na+-dependent transporter
MSGRDHLDPATWEAFVADEENGGNDDGDDENGNNSLMNVLSTVFSNLFLFFLIFGLSATVDMRNLRKQARNRFAITTGVAMQFLIMPVLGFLSVVILSNKGLTEAMGITLLVVTASPGGSYSNWWCSTFNAELALSVAMTTVSSVLSIALLPANLFFYTWLAYGVRGDSESQRVMQSLDWPALFLSLGIVLSAIVLGLLAGHRWDTPRFHVLANRVGSVCGLALILVSVFLSSGADGSESRLWNQPWAFYVGVMLPCLVGISLANLVGRTIKLSPPETVAISIECCYQNTGIATSVAVTMFNDREERAQAVAVPLFYGIVEAVVIGCYCVWAWKAGVRRRDSDGLC